MTTSAPSKTRARARGRGKGRASTASVTFDYVRKAAAKLPGVEEGLCYGTPGIRVKGKFLLRLRDDGESVAIKIPMDDREILLQADPKVFYITDHYRNYPAILFRLTEIRRNQLADLLELGWRFVAPKRLVAGSTPAPRELDDASQPPVTGHPDPPPNPSLQRTPTGRSPGRCR